MISQKNKIISKLEKYKIKYQVINENLIRTFLLYVEVDIVIKDEAFKLRFGNEFISKNFKKDIKRLRFILKDHRIVKTIESLEYFENKYGS